MPDIGALLFGCDILAWRCIFYYLFSIQFMERVIDGDFVLKMELFDSHMHKTYTRCKVGHLGHKKKKVCLRHPHALLCELHFARRATRWPLKNFFFLFFFIYFYF